MDAKQEQMKADIRQLIEEWSQPIDFDQLAASGILTREGAWYRVHRYTELPDSVRRRIGSTAHDKRGIKVKFSKLTKSTLNMAKKLGI